MFDFRVINCADGTQVIDHSLKTPYSALTPVQMEESTEIDTQIAVMEHLKRKAKRESDCKQGIKKNLFYKTAMIIQSFMTDRR